MAGCVFWTVRSSSTKKADGLRNAYKLPDSPADNAVVGRIVNVSADEKVLSENGKIDPVKLNALIFDQFQNGYYIAKEKVGKAWNAGADLMKK